ncbi:MAG TPA: hypothetical protein VHB93_00960 [Candidatus Paceibacterota bacterium]|nr:hypothetical protein [Candidatus Paceibacterota bacterium]
MVFDPSALTAFLETPAGLLSVAVVVLTITIGVLLVIQSARALRIERDSSSAGFTQLPLSTLPHYKALEHPELSTMLFPKTYTRARRPLLNGPDTR